jgi:hypothetical protein
LAQLIQLSLQFAATFFNFARVLFGVFTVFRFLCQGFGELFSLLLYGSMRRLQLSYSFLQGGLFRG